MRKSIVATFIAIALWVTGCSSQSNDGKTLKVLFVGNSLTSFNNLPQTVADIASSRGNELIYDAHAPGGAKLSQHASNVGVLTKVQAQPWDFVVLQEQSQLPGFAVRQLSREVFPYAQDLAETVKATHPSASAVFYMTMAHQNGDSANAAVYPELRTYEGMQKRINRSYLQMAQDNNALVAPVGEVWARVRSERPEIALYSDYVHPSRTGTYLAATVFYVTLFQEPSFGAAAPEQVDRETAQYLQRLADFTVLESATDWDWRQ